MCPLSVSVVISGQRDLFGFGFMTLKWKHLYQKITTAIFKINKQKIPSKKGFFMEGQKDPNFSLSHVPSCPVPLLPAFKLPLWFKRGIACVTCLLRIHQPEKRLTYSQDQNFVKSLKLRESNTLSIWPGSPVNINIAETEPDKCDNMTRG